MNSITICANVLQLSLFPNELLLHKIISHMNFKIEYWNETEDFYLIKADSDFTTLTSATMQTLPKNLIQKFMIQFAIYYAKNKN